MHALHSFVCVRAACTRTHLPRNNVQNVQSNTAAIAQLDQATEKDINQVNTDLVKRVNLKFEIKMLSDPST